MPDAKQVIDWLKYDARTAFFVNAIQYINWERIEGDILEFGVSVGKSLCLMAQLQKENLALWQYREPAVIGRRVAGFDSFAGLPDDGQFHPRWEAGSFATNYLANHPTLAYEAPITPESIRALFRAAGLAEPELEVGWFAETAARAIPGKYARAALVHIDSDLYASAKEALAAVAPILSDGALVCFDDWFMYRGHPDKGEQRAFREFLDERPEWGSTHYEKYSVFCNSFILYRRLDSGPSEKSGS